MLFDSDFTSMVILGEKPVETKAEIESTTDTISCTGRAALSHRKGDDQPKVVQNSGWWCRKIIADYQVAEEPLIWTLSPLYREPEGWVDSPLHEYEKNGKNITIHSTEWNLKKIFSDHITLNKKQRII